MFSWGIAWTNAKIVNQFLNYYNLTFLRFFIGFITLIPFLVIKKPKLNLDIKILINIIIVSILFFFYNICFFMGTDYGDAGKGGVFVTTTNPLITFILVSLISKKITMNQIFNISLGVIGGLLIMDLFKMGFDPILSSENRYFILCSVML